MTVGHHNTSLNTSHRGREGGSIVSSFGAASSPRPLGATSAPNKGTTLEFHSSSHDQ